MDSTNFRSQNGRFSLTLPAGWEEFDDSEEDDTEMTYAFANNSTEYWSGNFRITPYRWSDPNVPCGTKTSEFIQGELNDNSEAIKIQIGELECAFYTEEDPDGDEANAYYFWIAGVRDDLFVCSFTIDKEQKGTGLNSEQLDSVQSILRSLIIH